LLGSSCGAWSPLTIPAPLCLLRDSLTLSTTNVFLSLRMLPSSFLFSPLWGGGAPVCRYETPRALFLRILRSAFKCLSPSFGRDYHFGFLFSSDSPLVSPKFNVLVSIAMFFGCDLSPFSGLLHPGREPPPSLVFCSPERYHFKGYFPPAQLFFFKGRRGQFSPLQI